MANKKSKKQKTAKKAMKIVRVGRKALDAPALAYARLLADPCNAPLCHPIYPGTEAGFLFRAENFFSIADPGAGATTTCGLFHWTPGYVNAESTELLFTNNSAPGLAAATVASTSSPGKGFLAANARGMRCVAACMKITFIGAESQRSGRLHYGHTSAGMIDLGQSVTIDQVAQTLQHYCRTPADTVEVIWKPNIADTQFCDPTASTNAVARDARSAITMAVAGLPTGTGMTLHCTAIYEWTPAVNLGVGHNALGKARSSNSLDDVMDALVDSGYAFVRNAAGQAGMALGRGVVSGIVNTFGLMPTYQRNLSTRRLM